MPLYRIKGGDHSGDLEPVELPGGVLLLDLPGRDEGTAPATAYTAALVNAGRLEVVDPDAPPLEPLPTYDPVYVRRATSTAYANQGGGVLVPVGLGGGGGGLTAVEFIADLEEAPEGNPVVFVLEDLTLYGWDGAAWVPLGSGGGPDFITVPYDAAGLSDGEALVWDTSDTRFEPGALT